MVQHSDSQLTVRETSASSFNLTTQTLPVTGTYTIVVDPVTVRTGSINVEVTNP